MTRLLLAPLAVVATLAAGLWVLGGILATGKWSAVAISVAWFFVVSAVAARVVRRDPRLRVPVRGTFVACAAVASVAFYWTSVRKSEVDEAIAVPAAAIAPAEREAALRGAAPSATPSPTSTPTPTPTAAPRRRTRKQAAARKADRAERKERKERTPAAEPDPDPEPTRTPRPKPEPSATAEPTPTPAPAQDARLARGRFRGADGHASSGTATAVRRAGGGRRLTFSNFETDGGLDVRVYLVDGDGSDVKDHVELGRLKGERGNQQYTVPSSVDLSRYRTVVLWCIPYTVRVAVAPLR